MTISGGKRALKSPSVKKMAPNFKNVKKKNFVEEVKEFTFQLYKRLILLRKNAFGFAPFGAFHHHIGPSRKQLNAAARNWPKFKILKK